MVHIAALVLSLQAAVRLTAEEITVFAAASLTDALTEIGAAHEQATGDKVRFNFAASSTLARQIEAGAPADVFFSADEAQMNRLVGEGLVVSDSRKSLLGNTLVIVTALDGPAITREADLGKPMVRRISMGNPMGVPAGVYARQHLEKLGLWGEVAPKIAPVENVRAALAVVESGNAEAGVVYKTDAAVSKKVKVALEIPAADGPVIHYPVAMVSGSRHTAGARRFLARLDASDSAEVFTKRGFTLLKSNN